MPRKRVAKGFVSKEQIDEALGLEEKAEFKLTSLNHQLLELQTAEADLKASRMGVEAKAKELADALRTYQAAFGVHTELMNKLAEHQLMNIGTFLP